MTTFAHMENMGRRMGASQGFCHKLRLFNEQGIESSNEWLKHMPVSLGCSQNAVEYGEQPICGKSTNWAKFSSMQKRLKKTDHVG